MDTANDATTAREQRLELPIQGMTCASCAAGFARRPLGSDLAPAVAV